MIYEDLPYPLNEWGALLAEPKTIFSWPDWETPPVFSESKQAAAQAGRTRLVSHEAERCRLHVQLMDSTEATIEGAGIMLLMWRNRPMEDATALLNMMHEGKLVTISRIDIWPSAPHANRFWRRFKCPPELSGSHIHRFDENAALGRQAFDPYGNLPVAYPLEAEPLHLRDFLQVVGRAFNVQGLECLPPPPTQGSLV